VAARCPRLDRIYGIHGFVVEPTLELLISNPLESRAPVAPALTKRVSGPLVGNHTLRGSGFSSLGLRPCGGHTYSVRDQAILMPKVVAAVVRRGRALSGVAVAHVVGDMGCGRDGPPWLFGCRAVIIAHARARPFRRGGVRSSVIDAAVCS
jgi:hypothetical protein